MGLHVHLVVVEADALAAAICAEARGLPGYALDVDHRAGIAAIQLAVQEALILHHDVRRTWGLDSGLGKGTYVLAAGYLAAIEVGRADGSVVPH